jgi:hypothetical protein
VPQRFSDHGVERSPDVRRMFNGLPDQPRIRAESIRQAKGMRNPKGWRNGVNALFPPGRTIKLLNLNEITILWEGKADAGSSKTAARDDFASAGSDSAGGLSDSAAAPTDSAAVPSDSAAVPTDYSAGLTNSTPGPSR